MTAKRHIGKSLNDVGGTVTTRIQSSILQVEDGRYVFVLHTAGQNPLEVWDRFEEDEPQVAARSFATIEEAKTAGTAALTATARKLNERGIKTTKTTRSAPPTPDGEVTVRLQLGVACMEEGGFFYIVSPVGSDPVEQLDREDGMFGGPFETHEQALEAGSAAMKEMKVVSEALGGRMELGPLHAIASQVPSKDGSSLS